MPSVRRSAVRCRVEMRGGRGAGPSAPWVHGHGSFCGRQPTRHAHVMPPRSRNPFSSASTIASLFDRCRLVDSCRRNRVGAVAGQHHRGHASPTSRLEADRVSAMDLCDDNPQAPPTSRDVATPQQTVNGVARNPHPHDTGHQRSGETARRRRPLRRCRSAHRPRLRARADRSRRRRLTSTGSAASAAGLSSNLLRSW